MTRREPELTYDEFCNWAFERLFDALIKEGISGMKSCLKYTVIATLIQISTNEGFKK